MCQHSPRKLPLTISDCYEQPPSETSHWLTMKNKTPAIHSLPLNSESPQFDRQSILPQEWSRDSANATHSTRAHTRICTSHIHTHTADWVVLLSSGIVLMMAKSTPGSDLNLNPEKSMPTEQIWKYVPVFDLAGRHAWKLICWTLKLQVCLDGQSPLCDLASFHWVSHRVTGSPAESACYLLFW